MSGGEQHITLARQVHQVLHTVRQVLDVLKVQEAGHSLDRVACPKDGVEPVCVRRVHLQIQKQWFRYVKMLPCLGHEVRKKQRVTSRSRNRALRGPVNDSRWRRDRISESLFFLIPIGHGCSRIVVA